MARAKGIPVITGVEMFVQQGARQFEIWTGKPAPEEEMLRVVVHALRQQAEAAGELRSTPTPEPPLPAAAPQPEAARPVTGNAPAKPAPASRPSVKAPAKAAKSPAKSKK
jgi:3-dehydroquinate dehydratase/shikimate dehydrogenase